VRALGTCPPVFVEHLVHQAVCGRKSVVGEIEVEDVPARYAALDKLVHLLEEVERLAASPHASDDLHAVEASGIGQ